MSAIIHDDSAGFQPVKSWYSTLSTLQINTGGVSSNRISPLISAKRISSSPSVKKEVLTATTTSSPSLTHIFKRITRNPTIMRSNSSNVTKLLRKKGGQQQQKQVDDEGVRIYMKSPHVVANGELAGIIILSKPLDDTFQSIQLSLVGTEEVFNSRNHSISNHHKFLDLEIFNMTSEQVQSSINTTQDNIIEIPFITSLSPHLGGTFIDGKGSIQYNLKSEIKYNGDKLPVLTEKPVLIYPNFASLKDRNELNWPIVEYNKQVWKSSSSFLSVNLSLSRSIWMSGAPIYVTVNICNATIYTVCDMKLELLRKQNICCSTGDEEIMMPITSTCELVSETLLSSLGWWYPLKPNKQDLITLTIEAPPDQVTIRNQKLIDISFYIRMSITSSESTEVVAEIPIVLAHPVAMSPPPSLLSGNQNCQIIESAVIGNQIPRITLSDTAETKTHLIEYSASASSSDDKSEYKSAVMEYSPSILLSDIEEVESPITDQPPNNLLDNVCELRSNSLSDTTRHSSFDVRVEKISDTIGESTMTSSDTKAINNSTVQFVSTEPKSLKESTASNKSIASSLHSALNVIEHKSISSFPSNNNSHQFRPLTRSHTTSSNKINKMKRSFSTWGTLLTRKMSISNISKRSNRPPRPEISSPIISNHSISSCGDSIASSLHSSPASEKNHDIISIIHRNSREVQPQQRSIMKFGQIKGPKRFGQQPGSLGDAGLDIRKCFNVATATEVFQSFAAEKVEIPDDIPFYFSSSSLSPTNENNDKIDEEADYENLSTFEQFHNTPPYLEPVQLSENTIKWKQGFVAPPEKCQLDISMIDTTTDDDIDSKRPSISKYPIQQQEGTTKRMLASSRHLMNLQKNNAQSSKSGRSLLVMPSSSI